MSFSSPEQWGFPWWIANSPSCLPCQLIWSRPAWPSLSVHFLWLGPSSTNTWVIRQHFLVSNFLAPPSPILACVAGTTSITSNSTNIVELSRGIAAISQESTGFKGFQELWVTNFCNVQSAYTYKSNLHILRKSLCSFYAKRIQALVEFTFIAQIFVQV